MKRRSPVRHRVRSYTRGGKIVRQYQRGSGSAKKKRVVVSKGPDKGHVLYQVKQIIRGELPSDSEIIFFGGVVEKPWPRKDVDVLVVVHDEEWFDDLPVSIFGEWVDGSIEDIITGVNSHIERVTKLGGDVFVYVDRYGDMYHEDGRDGVIDVQSHSPELYEEVLEKTAYRRGK